MPDINQETILSERARRALLIFDEEYRRSGYMYSGCLAPGTVARQGFEGDGTRANAAILELMEAGIIRVRKCQAHMLELCIERRAYLIELHGLAHEWQEAAPFFYPNESHGEVTRVRAEHAMDLAQAEAEIAA